MKICPKYDNVFHVREEEDCINCYRSEYNTTTREVHCLYRDLEAKMKVRIAASQKGQKTLMEVS